MPPGDFQVNGPDGTSGKHTGTAPLIAATRTGG